MTCYVIDNVYGASESQRFKPIYGLIVPGDIVILCIEEKGFKSLGGKFVGDHGVVSDWFREDKLL